MDGDEIGKWMLIGSFVGAAVVLLANGFACEPRQCSTYWLGEGGVAGTLLGFGTFAAAAIGGAIALKSYRTNVRAELAVRFKEAIGMLANNQMAARVAALNIIEGVVREAPSTYRNAALRSLHSFVITHFPNYGTYDPYKDKPYPQDHRWETSDLSAAEAICSISRLRDVSGLWPQENFDLVNGGRFIITAAYLYDKTFDGDDLSRMFLANSVGGELTFINVKLRYSRIDIALFGYLHFRGCDLTDAVLHIVSNKGGLVPPSQLHKLVVVDPHCIISDAALINGVPMKEWASQK